jgi:hypothetical protein
MAEHTIPPEPDTPLLYLRAIRAILDDHTGKFDEIITRLGRLEREMAGSRRDITNLHEDWVGMAHRLDKFDTRLQRIERRLELIEDPTPTSGV